MPGLLTVAAGHRIHVPRLVTFFSHVPLLAAVVASSATTALWTVLGHVPSWSSQYWVETYGGDLVYLTLFALSASDIVEVGWFLTLSRLVAGFSIQKCQKDSPQVSIDYSPAILAGKLVNTWLRACSCKLVNNIETGRGNVQSRWRCPSPWQLLHTIASSTLSRLGSGQLLVL